MFKKFIIFSLLLILTSCSAPGTVFLGPTVTVARTGNIYQAGLSYGSGHVIQKTKESLEKASATNTIVYQRVEQIHQKIEKNKLSKVVLKDQADFFLKL